MAVDDRAVNKMTIDPTAPAPVAPPAYVLDAPRYAPEIRASTEPGRTCAGRIDEFGNRLIESNWMRRSGTWDEASADGIRVAENDLLAVLQDVGCELSTGWVEATIANGRTNQAGVMLCATWSEDSTVNGYALIWDELFENAFVLAVVTDSAFATLATGTVSTGSTVTYRLERAADGTLTAYIDGNPIASLVDATYTTGHAAIIRRDAAAVVTRYEHAHA